MTDRSDELTESRDSRSTEDLLEETDRLLEGTGAGSSSQSRAESPTEPDESPSLDGPSETDTESSRSRLSRLVPGRPSVSRDELFSPKAFLVLVALVAVGFLAGNAVIPVAGRLIGMFVVAFLAGLVASKRHYLEMTVAGVAAGGVATLGTEPLLFVAGSGTTVVGVGAAAGLVASVAGYYFGRDLRAGLARDVE